MRNLNKLVRLWRLLDLLVDLVYVCMVIFLGHRRHNRSLYVDFDAVYERRAYVMVAGRLCD